MLKEIRKGLLSKALLTKDNIRELTDELVTKGKLTEEDASEFADSLAAMGERHWIDMEKALSSAIESVLRKMDVAGKAEVRGLGRKTDAIEERLSAVEAILREKKES